jgi:hypothetical protein
MRGITLGTFFSFDLTVKANDAESISESTTATTVTARLLS